MARFDRVIPPGGEGKVTLKIDLKGFMGYVKKTGTVESNDSQSPKIKVTMTGRARPFIQIKPAALVSFRKGADEPNEKVVDIITNSVPFQITRVTSGLEGRVVYQLETVEEGKHYRIKISNLLTKGSYSGGLTVYTDMERKKEFKIYVHAIQE